MMGITGGLPEFHGRDTSADYLGTDREVVGDRIVYITNANKRWVAAVSRRYKLVLSPSDDPWLFDLERDPDELVNFYTNPEYKPVAEKMQAELMAQMKKYAEPALAQGNLVLEAGGTADSGAQPGGLSSSEGYVVDSGGHSVKGTQGAWSRAVTVPAGTFAADTAYELEIEWTSNGLEEGAAFFANFIDENDKKKERQIETWTGAAGESGVVRKTLRTNNSNGWILHVGVKDGGELAVKRIRIRKM
jgi:hypothetical protein